MKRPTVTNRGGSALDCYVFFDVDDTLLEWAVTYPEAFAQVAAEAGVAVTPEQVLAELSAHSGDVYAECVSRHAARGDMRDFWLDYDGRILAALGVSRDLPHHARRVVDVLSHPDACRLFPEVAGVLQTLAERGARLGIITGRPLADPDLRRLGILHYFDPIFDAFKARTSKEHGRMFHLAAEAAARAGVPAWHIGDNYRGDVLGARAAGLRPIFLDRHEIHGEVDCPKVRDLREAVEIISRV